MSPNTSSVRQPQVIIILRRTSFLRTVPGRFVAVFKLADLEIKARGDSKLEVFKKLLAKLRSETQATESEFRGRFHAARARHEGVLYPRREVVTIPESTHADRRFTGW